MTNIQKVGSCNKAAVDFSRNTFPEFCSTWPGRARKMLRVGVALKIVSCNMHVAKYIFYDVARKDDSFNIARKVDARLREKSLLQVVPCNITFKRVEAIFNESQILRSDLIIQGVKDLRYVKLTSESCLIDPSNC